MFLFAILLALAPLAGGLSAAEPDQPPITATAPDPFLRLRDTTLDYHGPAEDFTDLREIRLGWFAPSDPDDPLDGDGWWAANLAVDEANPLPPTTDTSAAATLPVRLVPRWAPDPWRAGVSLLARMVYDEQPLALLGSVDSASTHLAEQIVAKAQLPLVSPVATDKTATLAGVSWMFSCAPDDTAVARALVEDVLRTIHDNKERGRDGSPSRPPTPPSAEPPVGPPLAGARASQATPLQQPNTLPHGSSSALVLFATTDHDSRAAAREVMSEFSRRGRLPEFRFDLPPGLPDATEPLRRVAASDPAAVIVIANAPDSARLVRTVRAQLGGIAVFGGPALGRTRFLTLAGAAAEDARFPLLFTPDPADPVTAAFLARFIAARGHAPDYAAALTYDATRLLIEAVRRAGPNRARIREALVQLSPWSGIAGPIVFDGTGQNRRGDLRLGTIRHGAVVALPPASVQAGSALRAVCSADLASVGAPLAAPSAAMIPGAASGAPTRPPALGPVFVGRDGSPSRPSSASTVAVADASERRPSLASNPAFSPSP